MRQSNEQEAGFAQLGSQMDRWTLEVTSGALAMVIRWGTEGDL
jgi:hypothetical protein